MQQELPLEPAKADSSPKPAPKPAPRPRAPRKPKPPVRADMRLTGYITALIIALDQALKYWVIHVMQLDRVREIDLLPPWLNLRMAWNQGVNFGLFASGQDQMRWVLIGIALVISGWVWVWLWRSAAGRLGRIAGGLLIGGALGNVIDRVAYGAVADFLNMSLPGWQNPYSFNVADIAIFMGAFGLVLLPQGEPKPAKAAPKKTQPKPPARPRRPAAEKAADNTRDEANK
ncbi:signal peptidase II [Paracoccus homiensis]|uniref:Lipoprotein signal peptidase n=1 Tax=Paracoccus homiensis TaxID=364199 RepID=A0A1I0AZ45_9RHOB|nr:signal peptidase II [Paracoccus homiensis]SES99728.1 signal peptidase II Aspartic peptidase. MEROPS family A08 [Paracoccus homiensis]